MGGWIDCRRTERREERAALTGHGAQVEVLPDDLLELAVHRGGGEALAQVQAEILAQREA